MHEPYEEELKRRLQQYTEEPQEGLWKAISGRVTAENASAQTAKKLGRQLLGSLLLAALVLSFLVPETIEHQTASLLQPFEKLKKAAPPRALEASASTTALATPVTRVESVVDPHMVGTDHEVISQTGHRNQVEVPAVEPAFVDNQEKLTEGVVIPSDNSEPVVPRRKSGVELVEPDDSGKRKLTTAEKLMKRRKQEVKYDRFSVYFTVMPTFGYQRIESNTSDNIIVESIKRIPAFSFDRLGVRAELGAETPLSNRFKAFGGFLYYQREQTITYTEKQLDGTIIKPGPDGEIILEPQFSHVEKSFEYELQNLGVQLGLNYQIWKQKFLHVAGTGLEFQIALNKMNERNEFQGFTNNPTAYVFYNLYYRVQYPSEGRFKAVFQPTLNYSFYINENLNAPFYVKPYGLGLNIGCTYKF